MRLDNVKIVFRTSCPCVNDKRLTPVVKQYQDAVLELQKAYEGSDDFAVVVQTFSSKQTIPFDVSLLHFFMLIISFLVNWRARLLVLCTRLLPLFALRTRVDVEGTLQ